MSDLIRHLIPYICLLGLFLPMVLFFYNKGFKSANRFLAGFLFFASLYLLESFTFFYVDSKAIVAFFTNTHGLYYLIGPFAFLYVRSTLKDNSRLTKIDVLHFIPFFTFFIGSNLFCFHKINNFISLERADQFLYISCSFIRILILLRLQKPLRN